LVVEAAVRTTSRYWPLAALKLTTVGWAPAVQLATVVQVVPLGDTSTL
jgi:hypothetical protein